jgi:hypothetical protein
MNFKLCQTCRFYSTISLEDPFCRICMGEYEKPNWQPVKKVSKDCNLCETLNCNECSNK